MVKGERYIKIKNKINGEKEMVIERMNKMKERMWTNGALAPYWK